jgi:CxxC motif-containing protein (DUF1111 family)
MVAPRHFASLLVAGVFMFGSAVSAQNPVGTILQHANNVEINAYNSGKLQFTRPWGIQEGLGTVFTASRCVTCHLSPVPGGSSSRTNTFFGKLNSDNTFDELIGEGGPLLQTGSIASFVLPAGTCVLVGEKVPKDANVIEKRLTPPLYGLGLIDAIDDQTIINGAVDQGDGIHGTVNMVLDQTTGTMRPGRFGAKAFRSSLVEFVAEAFGHDFGISNPLQPTEDLPQGVAPPVGCLVDTAVPNNTNTTSAGKGIFNLSHFVRYTSPNIPQPLTGNVLAGHDVFISIGCGKCHTPSMTTPAAVLYLQDLSGTLFGPSPSLSNLGVGLYSDLLLHDMGATLASGFPANLTPPVNPFPLTGMATNQQWRTTPLWGLALRSIYLHDGRTTDLNTAIVDHSPDGTGEAGIVIGRYTTLSQTDQQNLLAFLKSL